jgi:hypothetical protein
MSSRAFSPCRPISSAGSYSRPDNPKPEFRDAELPAYQVDLVRRQFLPAERDNARQRAGITSPLAYQPVPEFFL